MFLETRIFQADIDIFSTLLVKFCRPKYTTYFFRDFSEYRSSSTRDVHVKVVLGVSENISTSVPWYSFSPHPRWKSVNLKNITSSFKHNQTSSWPLLRSTSSIMFDICLYSLWGIVYMYTVFSLLSDWTDSRQVSLIQHILNSASYPNKSNEVTEFESSNHGHFLLKWPLKRFD